MLIDRPGDEEFIVGALGGISLVVGGVGIFTIMTIAVKERTAEIGLLTALGAGDVRCYFYFYPSCYCSPPSAA